MAMMVLLVPAGSRDVTVGAGEASQLAEFGVTHVSLLRNGETVAVVLEGWAFDPDRSAGRVHEVMAGSAGPATILHEVAQLALSSTPSGSGGETE